MEESEARQAATPLGALFVVTTAFFLSELGDKTQLATVSIASERDDFVGVWLGSTAGDGGGGRAGDHRGHRDGQALAGARGGGRRGGAVRGVWHVAIVRAILVAMDSPPHPTSPCHLDGDGAQP